MKHFHNSYRKLLKFRNLKQDRKKFSPKYQDVVEWFNIINETIFNNQLSIFDGIEIKSYHQYHALFHSWEEDGVKFNLLEVSKSFRNRKLFVEILAHEMIHLYQHTYNEPMDHGTSFLKWRFAFKQKGLELYRTK